MVSQKFKFTNVEEIYIKCIDYIVGMEKFIDVFNSFPKNKEASKISQLDEYLVSGSMKEFNELFHALNKSQGYKEYTNSVITDDYNLFNEIYDKFI